MPKFYGITLSIIDKQVRLEEIQAENIWDAMEKFDFADSEDLLLNEKQYQQLKKLIKQKG